MRGQKQSKPRRATSASPTERRKQKRAKRGKRSKAPSKAENQRTRTLVERRTYGEHTRITALRRLRDQLIFPLERDDSPVQWIQVGTAKHCDIVLDGDDSVSRVHCFLLCSKDKVEVRDFDSKNRTLVNTIPLVDGRGELRPGNVLELGETQLVAIGEDSDQKPDLTAPGVYGRTRQVLDYHGGCEYRAALALGVPPSTFARWLETEKFKVPER